MTYSAPAKRSMTESAVNPKKILLVLAAFAGGVFLVGLPVHRVLSSRPASIYAFQSPIRSVVVFFSPLFAQHLCFSVPYSLSNRTFQSPIL